MSLPDRPAPELESLDRLALDVCGQGGQDSLLDCQAILKEFAAKKEEAKIAYTTWSNNDIQKHYDLLCDGGITIATVTQKRCDLLLEKGATRSHDEFLFGVLCLVVVVSLAIWRANKLRKNIWRALGVCLLLLSGTAIAGILGVFLLMGIAGTPVGSFVDAAHRILFICIALGYGFVLNESFSQLTGFSRRNSIFVTLLILGFYARSTVFESYPVSQGRRLLAGIPIQREFNLDHALTVEEFHRLYPNAKSAYQDSIFEGILARYKQSPNVRLALTVYAGLAEKIGKRAAISAEEARELRKTSESIANCLQSELGDIMIAEAAATEIYLWKLQTKDGKSNYRQFLRSVGIYPNEQVDKAFLGLGPSTLGCKNIEQSTAQEPSG